VSFVYWVFEDKYCFSFPQDRRHIEATVALKVPRLSRKEHNASVKICAVHGFEQKPYRPPG